MTAELVDRIAKGEPQSDMMSFVLTVSDDAYEINRLWGSDHEATVSILRSDLPAGCDTVSFFLNGSSNELQVAQLVYTHWNTGGKLPLPDEIYHPCALLVS
jgi:hypothetical protein